MASVIKTAVRTVAAGAVIVGLAFPAAATESVDPVLPVIDDTDRPVIGAVVPVVDDTNWIVHVEDSSPLEERVDQIKDRIPRVADPDELPAVDRSDDQTTEQTRERLRQVRSELTSAFDAAGKQAGSLRDRIEDKRGSAQESSVSGEDVEKLRETLASKLEGFRITQVRSRIRDVADVIIGWFYGNATTAVESIRRAVRSAGVYPF